MHADSDSQDELLQSLIVRIADDFADRLRRGESPNIEARLAEFPDHAAVVRDVIRSCDLVRDLSRYGKADETNRSVLNDRMPNTIGDFTIVREIGRGGMGVVYEARQNSLDRRVALKVLPLGMAGDERQARRFQVETQAVARLQHPHITSVFEIGCDHGIHFYAMALIKGRTIEQLIKELSSESEREIASAERGSMRAVSTHLDRSATKVSESRLASRPVTTAFDGVNRDATGLTSLVDAARTDPNDYFRHAARLGIQVAEALDHAHRMGVVHRDIKPSNLMLDVNGEAWVTDFGLAHIGLGPKLTMTGELLGTLRYMSPEQASAGQQNVDHRTDIYSLGATLYELLTLRAPFDAANRAALFHQVFAAEPIALSRVNAAIPRDLNVIVLKAMAKDRNDRYATAQEMADDLRRFLQGLPIRGRSPTVTQRVNQWSRRHRTVVWSGILLLLITSMGLAVSNFAIHQRKTQTERERQRAERNLEIARDVVDRMFTHVADDLRELPHAEHIRRQLLEEALEFYQVFLTERQTNPDVRHDVGLAHFRAGEIYELLGKSDLAEQSFRDALPIYEQLTRESIKDLSLLDDLADAHAALASRLVWDNRNEEMLLHRRRELAIRNQLLAVDPTGTRRQRLALTLTELGNSLKTIDEQESERHLRQAIDVLRDDQGHALANGDRQTDVVGTNAHCHQWLGVFMLQVRGDLNAAEQYLRKAAELRQQIADKQPTDPDVQGALAQVQGYLAEALMRIGRLQEASASCLSAISLRQQLASQFPGVVEHRRHLAWLYEVYSDVEWSRGQPDECIKFLTSALSTRIEISATRNSRQPYADELVWNHYRLGIACFAVSRHGEAQEAFQHAIRLAEQVAVADEGVANPGHVLPWQLANCPVTSFRDPERAVRLVEQEPQSAPIWRQTPLSGGHDFLMGVALYRAGRWHEAEAALSNSIRASHAVDCRRWLFLTLAELQLGSRAEAQQSFMKAKEHLHQHNFNDPELWLLFREVDDALDANSKARQ